MESNTPVNRDAALDLAFFQIVAWDKWREKMLRIPPHKPDTYFALGEASWVRKYTRNNPPPDHWYVVRVTGGFDGMAFLSTSPNVIARFRHPHGRLFVLEEGIEVVNALNEMSLAVIACALEVGGLTKLVRQVSTELLLGEP
jgi:hypothetical protein